jgi:hypothetical protein
VLDDGTRRLAKLWASRKTLGKNRFPFSLRADSVLLTRRRLHQSGSGRIGRVPHEIDDALL